MNYSIYFQKCVFYERHDYSPGLKILQVLKNESFPGFYTKINLHIESSPVEYKLISVNQSQLTYVGMHQSYVTCKLHTCSESKSYPTLIHGLKQTSKKEITL